MSEGPQLPGTQAQKVPGLAQIGAGLRQDWPKTTLPNMSKPSRANTYYVDTLGRPHCGLNHTILKKGAVGDREQILTIKQAELANVPFGTRVSEVPNVQEPTQEPTPKPAEQPSTKPLLDLLPEAPPIEPAPGETPAQPAGPADLLVMEQPPEAPAESTTLAAHDPNCPYCKAEPHHCPRGHEYYPVHDADVALFAMAYSMFLVAKRSSDPDHPRPMSAAEVQIVSDAVRGVLARRGGAALGKYGDLLGMVGATLIVMKGTFEHIDPRDLQAFMAQNQVGQAA